MWEDFPLFKLKKIYIYKIKDSLLDQKSTLQLFGIRHNLQEIYGIKFNWRHKQGNIKLITTDLRDDKFICKQADSR